jgi:hypothetical protein
VLFTSTEKYLDPRGDVGRKFRKLHSLIWSFIIFTLRMIQKTEIMTCDTCRRDRSVEKCMNNLFTEGKRLMRDLGVDGGLILRRDTRMGYERVGRIHLA